jgi:hypothetical protein
MAKPDTYTPTTLLRTPNPSWLTLCGTGFSAFLPAKVETLNGCQQSGQISFHLVSEFGKRAINGFSRYELQDFLDHKAKKGLSYSVVSHLRWDLKQIFELALAE